MKTILKIIGGVIIFAILLVVGFFGIMTIAEFKPADVEQVDVGSNSAVTLKADESISVMSWNIGYGALGETADFFMDGGTSVMTATEDEVNTNMSEICTAISEINPDIRLMQEVDVNSKRSHGVDETDIMRAAQPSYDNAFACNFKTLFVPIPVTEPMGRVESGIMTMSKYKITDASRISLPCPFKYPVSVFNLKRCLLVSRIPIENSDKELVVINLHLEAYDDGSGKIAQTKQLVELINSEVEKGNYVIAGGDFNQSLVEGAFPVIDENLWAAGDFDFAHVPDDMSIETGGNIATCRSLDKPLKDADRDNFQYYLIDGFIVSNNINVQDVKTIDKGFVNSDHNPVTMEFTLAD